MRASKLRAVPNSALPTTEFRNYSGPAWERSYGGVRIKDKTKNLKFPYFLLEKVFLFLNLSNMFFPMAF